MAGSPAAMAGRVLVGVPADGVVAEVELLQAGAAAARQGQGQTPGR